MKRTTLILGALGTLALAPAASGAVVLEPGTTLTVVCGAKPFGGSPFSATESGASMRRAESHRRAGRGLVLRRYSDSRIGLTNDNGMTPVVLEPETVRVNVRKLRRHRFRIRTVGEQTVTWRGC